MKKLYIRFILCVALMLLKHIGLEVTGWKIASEDIDGLEGIN